jgi:hypothetical protein
MLNRILSGDRGDDGGVRVGELVRKGHNNPVDTI